MQIFYKSFLGPCTADASSQEQADRLMNLLRAAGGSDFRVSDDRRGWVFTEGKGWF